MVLEADGTTMQAQLRALLEKHCATIAAEIGLLHDRLARLDVAAADRAAVLREAHEVAHRLKGGSGSIGFHAVSAAATRLDDRLRAEICACPDTLPGTDRELHDLLGALKELGEVLTPESSALYNVDLSQAAAPARTR